MFYTCLIIFISTIPLSWSQEKGALRQMADGETVNIFDNSRWMYICYVAGQEPLGNMICKADGKKMLSVYGKVVEREGNMPAMSTIDCDKSARSIKECKLGWAHRHCMGEFKVLAVTCGDPSAEEKSAVMGSHVAIILGCVAAGLVVLAVLICCGRRIIREIRYRASKGRRDGLRMILSLPDENDESVEPSTQPMIEKSTVPQGATALPTISIPTSPKLASKASTLPSRQLKVEVQPSPRRARKPLKPPPPPPKAV